jgi:5'-methylthioadenosine phosphorylase
VGGLAVVGGNATEGISLEAPAWVALDRHGGGEGYVLPHRIDHVANLRRATAAGCDRVLAICSVGGLQPQLGPGTLLCPDDFIALGGSPTSRRGWDAHTVPGFAWEWRSAVVERWSEAAEAQLVDGGTYWQSVGPRLETPAEVRMISRFADVVGMTMASECTVAAELGLDYAAICVVDNYANGVGEEELTMAELAEGRERNRELLRVVLAQLLPLLA